MQNKYYIFREPNNFDELKALLLLRYRVFRESRLEKFVSENEAGIDLDCYDLYSHHFGLYEHDGDRSRPVGYIRMVTDQPGTFRDELFDHAKSIPSIYEKVNRIPKEPFPVMNYCPYRNDIREYYANMKLQGEKLVEAGRLSLDNSVRGLKIATNFIALIFASFLVHNVDKTILACRPNHKNIYNLFGAIVFDSTIEFQCDEADSSALLLLAAMNLPDSVKEKVYKMAEVYKKFGRICYNPSEPENYLPPLGAYMKSKPVFAPAVESVPLNGPKTQTVAA
ncbi:MAG: GNAT family N-acetyltransferase [Ignavibacteriales bacterium]|nr:GNAT family N-acetyltransferase [Ignavibacteriales bacterium]